jgi:hypothetical protein
VLLLIYKGICSDIDRPDMLPDALFYCTGIILAEPQVTWQGVSWNSTCAAFVIKVARYEILQTASDFVQMGMQLVSSP